MFFFFLSLSHPIRSPSDRNAPSPWAIRSVRVLSKATIWSTFSCSTGVIQSAVMKFSLIVAVVVLALAQGSFAQEALNLDNLSQYFEDLKNKMPQDLSEIIRNPDLVNQARTFLEERKAQLEPLAIQIQEQLRAASTNVEEQLKPLATQLQPMFENLQKQVEAMVQTMRDQAAAIGN
uniref:Type-4 ice-structuring protein n=2 Tax=Haplochromini TaxID=319058 RepID=A0A3P9DN05_9CICH|nr:type-4 ice-structuring protein [Maylandia zebra]